MKPRDFFLFIWSIPRCFLQGLIIVYQKTLSLDHGFFAKYYPYRVCKYYPTCSQYGYEAIGRFGVLRGGCMTVWRILRCNPWSHGGVDEVPHRGEK